MFSATTTDTFDVMSSYVSVFIVLLFGPLRSLGLAWAAETRAFLLEASRTWCYQGRVSFHRWSFIPLTASGSGLVLDEVHDLGEDSNEYVSRSTE